MARLNPLRLEKETLLRLTAAAGAAVLGGTWETQYCPGGTINQCITPPYDTVADDTTKSLHSRNMRPTTGISASACISATTCG